MIEIKIKKILKYLNSGNYKRTIDETIKLLKKNPKSSYLKNLLESEGHLINPNVSVRLLNSKVTILGEVKKPGTYSFTENNISFLQALGLASDLTIDGDRKKGIRW